MRIASRGTPEFWRLYHALPADVRATVRKNYRLWQAHAFHPSLRFKPIGPPNWSTRVGDHYRAVGRFIDDIFLWEWIGSPRRLRQAFLN